MNKMISIAPLFKKSVTRFIRSQIVHDISALWAVSTFILGMIYFSQVATALVLMVREIR